MPNKREDVYEEEFTRITNLFEQLDDTRKNLALGLIVEASELRADLWELNKLKKSQGIIRVCPTDKTKMKVNDSILNSLTRVQTSYSNIIKSINSITRQINVDEADEFDEFDKSYGGK